MEGALRRAHDWVYPPDSDCVWYRQGKVRHSSLSRKCAWFAAYTLLMAAVGSGYVAPLVVVAYGAALRYVHDVAVLHVQRNETFFGGIDAHALATSLERPEWYPLAQTWWFILVQSLASGAATMITYDWAARRVLDEFYVRRKDDAASWKCQPTAYLTPDRAREEKLLGCFNAFLAGFFGVLLYFVHLNRPFLKFEYEVSSWPRFFGSAAFCYVWIDFWSYAGHNLLHRPWLYRNIHKVHHRYVHPTPYSAFALHPFEFIFFQSFGIICCSVFQTHILGYLAVVLFIAYHNQIDHSGVDFEGELPWLPSTAFHDDHHAKFHLNFGLHLVLWDWLFGTLRKKSRVYAEDRFVGQQEAAALDAAGDKKRE